MRLACSCSRNTWTSARILPFGASINCASSFCTISAREKWPSQSSRMMRPVPSTRIAPSGKSTTGDSMVPPQRHPAANFGMLSSVSSAKLPRNMLRTMFGISFNSKSLRRRPAWLDISEIERVELRPEDVTLVAQCLDGALLLCSRIRVIEHVLKREGRIFRRLRQSRLKIIEPRREPGIVLTQFLHPERDQVARKNFGQRRRDALEERPCPHQVEILISDKARRGENLAHTHHPLAIQPGRFRQLDPAQDSALSPVVSVVIHDAFPPNAPKRRIGCPRKNYRVFHWNNRLVVITIQRPGLQLSAAKFAFVHEQVEGMFVVIALFADLAPRRAQLLKRKLRSICVVPPGYSSSCQLSSATSQPAWRTARCSALDSFRIGFVLLR